MPSSKIIRYRVSFWTKGYNKGKVNAVIETESGNTMLIENLDSDQGHFLLNLLSSPGQVTCDPESNDGLLHLHHTLEEVKTLV